MSKITLDNLSDNLKAYLEGLGLSEEQVLNLINENGLDEEELKAMLKDTMRINELNTNSKTVIGAINELFQSANNGKQLIANAIGEPLSSEDTFSAMSDKISAIVDILKNNIIAKGITISDEKLLELVNKVSEIGGSTDEIVLNIMTALSQSLGEPTTANDTTQEMCGKIDVITQSFRDKLAEKGVNILGSEKINELVEKVDFVALEGGSVGQWVEVGTFKPNVASTSFNKLVVVDDMIYAVCGMNGTAIVEDKVNTLQCFDISTNKWTTKASAPLKVSDAGITVSGKNIHVIAGYGYVTDGYSGGGTNIQGHNIYNTTTNTWTSGTQFPVVAYNLNNATECNGKIYVIGGSDRDQSGGTAYSTNYMYDTSTSTWTTKANCPVSWVHVRALKIGTNIHALYGKAAWNSSYPRQSHYCYDTISNTWSEKSVAPSQRTTGTPYVVYYKDKLYVIGGVDTGVYGTDVERCDLVTDKWEFVEKVPFTKFSHFVTIDDKMYTITAEGFVGYYEDIELPNTTLNALVNAVGEPCNASDDIYDVCDKINVITDRLADVLKDEGVEVEEGERLNSLITKVDEEFNEKNNSKVEIEFSFEDMVELQYMGLDSEGYGFTARVLGIKTSAIGFKPSHMYVYSLQQPYQGYMWMNYNSITGTETMICTNIGNWFDWTFVDITFSHNQGYNDIIVEPNNFGIPVYQNGGGTATKPSAGYKFKLVAYK